MFLQIILFFILLVILFLLSQKIQTHIYNGVYIVTKNKKFSVGVLIILLLPGTIAHELSHFVVATILRVPTGELSIFPTIEKSGEVKAGKLMLGETDPLRLSLIGVSPIIIGLLLIYFTGKFFIPDISRPTTNNPQLTTIMLFVVCYLLFVVSLTMFSSKKDLQGLIIAGPIAFLLIVASYWVGIRVFLENDLWQKIQVFLTDLNFYLLITAVINYLVFLVSSVSLSFWRLVLKRKID